MHRHALTLVILAFALAAYVAGYTVGSAALFIAGGALELWFWVRLVRATSRPDAESPRVQSPRV